MTATFSSEKTRNEIQKQIAQSRKDCMFGDGLEDDYIWDGVRIVGLNEMDDEELAEEFGSTVESINRAAAEGKPLHPDDEDEE